MRTTLSIEDDVLAAAKELAKREGKSVGKVISALAREALRQERFTSRTRNGIPLLEARPGDAPVTPGLVNGLLDELP